MKRKPEAVASKGTEDYNKSIPIKMLASFMLLILAAGLMPGCSKAEPLEFSSASVYQLAESYGFEVVKSSHDITDAEKGDGDYALIFATTDPDTASQKYDEVYNLQGFSPDCDATEFFLLTEHKGKEDSRMTTVAFLFTFETEEMAQDVYADIAEGWTLDIKESGEIDGYSYTIGYCDENHSLRWYEWTSNDDGRYGIYMKDRTVFMFINHCPLNKKPKFVDYFCEGMGLISPSTLKDKLN